MEKLVAQQVISHILMSFRTRTHTHMLNFLLRNEKIDGNEL